MGEVMRSRGGCGEIGVVNKIKEFIGGFSEEMFKAVSYVVTTVIILAIFELQVGLKSEWNNVQRGEFNGG